MNHRKKCLLCKKPMARWVYGEPDIDALREQLLNGEIVLGGCCLSNRSPKWACITCCISYRSDGIGYLDHNLIDNYENQDDNWFLLQGKEIDFNPKESESYKLPEKIQVICSNDFLKENNKKRSVGFYFQEGGYNSAQRNISYLDGILVWNEYESLFDSLQIHDNQLPTHVYVLPPKVKKAVNHFITSSKWKKDYFQPTIDGTQWEFHRLVETKIKKSYGSNDFPPVYEELQILLNRILYGTNEFLKI